MDDPFISCPYERSHRVPRSRIQAHIVKCEKKYPELKICPFNHSHRFPASLLKSHVTNCPSKPPRFPQDELAMTAGALRAPIPISQKEYLPETDPNHEMWDN